MKAHLKHLALCAPMLVIGGVLLATGTGLGVLIPIAGCVLMMGLMMGAMGMLGSSSNDRWASVSSSTSCNTAAATTWSG